MELYCLEAKEDYVVFVDVKYPAVAYKIANATMNEDGELFADITILGAQVETQDNEFPPDLEAHEEEVLKEFLVLLEKQAG